jgi:hypothetical protein
MRRCTRARYVSVDLQSRNVDVNVRFIQCLQPAILSCLCVFFLAACTPGRDAAPQSVREVRNVPNEAGKALSRIIFASGDSITVPLIAVEVVKSFVASDGRSWLLISGVPCSECDAPKVLAFVAADAQTVDDLTTFAYPGEFRQLGEENGPVHFRSRLFVGKCLSTEVGAVQLSEQLDSLRQWQRRRVDIELAERPRQISRELRPSVLDSLTVAVRAGRCTELAGEQQYAMLQRRHPEFVFRNAS